MKQLIFQATLTASVEAGQTIRVFEDGSGEGLPEGTIVSNYFIPLIQELQGQLIASQAQQESQWISVEERLPEMNTPVLALVGKNVYALARIQYDEGWAWSIGGSDLSDFRNYEADDNYQPTHWMPLPANHIPDTTKMVQSQAKPAQEPVNKTPNDDHVICPNCAHDFRAIPVNVQELMIDAGFDPPFMDPVKQESKPIEIGEVRHFAQPYPYLEPAHVEVFFTGKLPSHGTKVYVMPVEVTE